MAPMGAPAVPQLLPGDASTSRHSHTFRFRLGVGVELLPRKSSGNVHWGPRLLCLNPKEWFINRSGVTGGAEPSTRPLAASSSPSVLTPPFPRHDTQAAKESGGGFQGESPISNLGGIVRDRDRGIKDR